MFKAKVENWKITECTSTRPFFCLGIIRVPAQRAPAHAYRADPGNWYRYASHGAGPRREHHRPAVARWGACPARKIVLKKWIVLVYKAAILYTISSGEHTPPGATRNGQQAAAGAAHRSPQRPEVTKGRSDGGKERLTHELKFTRSRRARHWPHVATCVVRTKAAPNRLDRRERQQGC